jgi:polar amino acid transport system substrate-binding protein
MEGGEMDITRNLEESSFCFVTAAIVITLLFCATAANCQNAPKGNVSITDCSSDLPFILLLIQANVQGSLNDLDADVANVSKNLSATGIEGNAADGVLNKLLETNSNLVKAFTFNKDGKVVAVECKGCGANVSSQELLSMHSAENLSQSTIDLIAYVLATRDHAFSKVYKMTEGRNATALAYPVFSPQNELLGGIVATVEPHKLLNAMVAPQLHFNVSTRSNITDYSFWMLTLDGLVAYDRDESQIGLDLFNDPLFQPFPSLLDLGKRIITERSGHRNYSFQVTQANEKVVTKDTYWTTVGLHGREWRLVVTKIIE